MPKIRGRPRINKIVRRMEIGSIAIRCISAAAGGYMLALKVKLNGVITIDSSVEAAERLTERATFPLASSEMKLVSVLAFWAQIGFKITAQKNMGFWVSVNDC